MLTPRSAAADGAAPTHRLTADTLGVDLRIWIEAGIGLGPFVAWLVAGISDTPKLAMAAYLVIAGLLLVRPQTGYLALLPMLPFNYSQAFQPHGPIFVLAGLALASVLIRCAIGSARLPRSVLPALWCSLVFLALTAFQLFLGVREFGAAIPFRALSQYDQVFIILSVFAVGLVILPGRSPAPYHIAFLASFAIVTIVGILNFVEPRTLKALGLAWTVSQDAIEGRASGIIPNPNFLGLFLACGLSWIVVTAIWHVAHGRMPQTTLLLPIVPFAGIAMILTFSRAAIVAMGAGILLALARRSVRSAGVLAVAAVIAVVLIYPVFIQIRLGQTFGDTSPAGHAAFNESDRLRGLMAESAVKAFLDAPIAGHGFSTFSEISPDYSGQKVLTSAHNLYLKVAAEQGLIGLGLLGALLLSIVVPMWRAGPGPWIASLAACGAFAAFSLTADTLGSAQTVSGAFFLLASGVAQAGFTRERVLAAARSSPLGSPITTHRAGSQRSVSVDDS